MSDRGTPLEITLVYRVVNPETGPWEPPTRWQRFVAWLRALIGETP